jgi:cell wall assembly regulator SMI1
MCRSARIVVGGFRLNWSTGSVDNGLGRGASRPSERGRTVSGQPGERQLTELLRQVDSLWHSKGIGIGEHTVPGTSAERVRSALDGLGLGVPAELVTWFTWHDGQDHRDGLIYDVRVDDLWLLSLDEAVADTEFQRSLSAQESGPDWVLWPDHWLVLCNDGGGGCLGVDCTGSDLAPAFEVERDDLPFPPGGERAPDFACLRDLAAHWVSTLSALGPN